jgi:hypothetical protein
LLLHGSVAPGIGQQGVDIEELLATESSKIMRLLVNMASLISH